MQGFSSKIFRNFIVKHSGSNMLNKFSTVSNFSEAKCVVGQLPIFWHDEVSSTMDTARDQVKSPQNSDIFAIVAQRQTRGRGTRGRTWMYGSKNLLMTLAIKRTIIPVPLHLLPLRVGTLIAEAVSPLVTAPHSSMKLKWPNDVLIDGKKVCGILIEMENDHLLIGIGCNVMTAPEVSTLGSEAGRSSTALYLHNAMMAQSKLTIASSLSSNDFDPPPQGHFAPSLQDTDYHELLAIRIMQSFQQWIMRGRDNADAVISDFSQQMDFAEQRLRDVNDDTKNRIQPIRLNCDGTLQVRYLSDGSEGCLVADYLW